MEKIIQMLFWVDLEQTNFQMSKVFCRMSLCFPTTAE